jgi:hypothetical protein
MWENIIHAYSDPTLLNENLLYVLKRAKIPPHPACGGTRHSAVFSHNGVPIA